MLIIKRVTVFEELEGIKALQNQNLKKNLSVPEAEKEGFVTAEYSIDFLRALHESCPSIIAKVNDQVVGYALVATKSIRNHHALLSDLFDAIDKIVFKGNLLGNTNYVVVGQLCVATGFRGLGLVQRMYTLFKASLNDIYDYCITDVAIENPRSLKAHEKTGFQIIDTLEYGGTGWHVILWNWNDK